MRPDWRDQAREHEGRLREPRDTTGDAKTLAELHEKLEGAQLVENKAGGFVDADADYLLVARRVNAAKGKWRIVPTDAEEWLVMCSGRGPSQHRGRWH